MRQVQGDRLLSCIQGAVHMGLGNRKLWASLCMWQQLGEALMGRSTKLCTRATAEAIHLDSTWELHEKQWCTQTAYGAG